MGTFTSGYADLSPLTEMIGTIIGSPQRFKQQQLNLLMQRMSRDKPWNLAPPIQKQWYETNVKYEPPLPRQWFRGEKPEYLIPKAREARAKGGEVTAEGTKYWEPQQEAYFEEPAQPPLWTEQQLEEVNALASKLYGSGESEDKTTFIRGHFGGQRPLVGDRRAEEEAQAGAEMEKILTENPEIANEPNAIKRGSMIRSKMPPNLIAPFTRMFIPRAEAEERLIGAGEAREETKRFHTKTEEDRTTRTGILKDREKRLTDHTKFREGLATAKDKRLVESAKTAKGSKTPDAAIKAADTAYQNYLKEFRYEITANNKLQAEFLKRAQAVGDTDFVPQYLNPMTERPMGYQDWLESEEGYPYAQRVRELGGAKEGGGVVTPSPTPRQEKDAVQKFGEKYGIKVK